jgi:hypothetical protein
MDSRDSVPSSVIPAAKVQSASERCAFRNAKAARTTGPSPAVKKRKSTKLIPHVSIQQNVSCFGGGSQAILGQRDENGLCLASPSGGSCRPPQERFRCSFGHHCRANHLQHAPNAIVPTAAAFLERRTRNRLPVVAITIGLGLRQSRQRWIILPVVAAHFVNDQPMQ